MRSLHRYLVLTLLIGVSALSPSLVANKTKCAFTKPAQAFVPPKPYWAGHGEGEFYYGTPALWTIVYPGWHVHSGGKLPFWRVGFDWRKEGRPRLTVVARRLDGERPLVWSGLPGSGFPEGKLEEMFMVTGVDIPSSGCWEIAAHYVAASEIQTLSYTVWVDP